MDKKHNVYTREHRLRVQMEKLVIFIEASDYRTREKTGESFSQACPEQPQSRSQT